MNPRRGALTEAGSLLHAKYDDMAAALVLNSKPSAEIRILLGENYGIHYFTRVSSELSDEM